MKKLRIPRTDSIDKLAKFWDHHDVTDFIDQLDEVPDRVFETVKRSVLTIDLTRQEAEAVRRIARAKRIAPRPLLQKWVVEGIRREAALRSR